MEVYLQIGVFDDNSLMILSAADGETGLEIMLEEFSKTERKHGGIEASRIFTVTLGLSEQQIAELVRQNIANIDASSVSPVKNTS